MPVQTIMSLKNDIQLGDTTTIIVSVVSATPQAVIDVSITAGNPQPTDTIHCNAAGSGACVFSNVLLGGVVGTVTHVNVVSTAVSNLDGPIPSTATTVRVHG